MNMLPPIPPKRYSQKTPTSIVLGGISIISTLIALRITISFYDYLLDDGAGWPFAFFLGVIPLMIFSFILSMNGIRHSSAQLPRVINSMVHILLQQEGAFPVE